MGASCEGPDTSSDPLSFVDIIGTYTANFGTATRDEIALLADSTYVHTYIGGTDEQFTDTGRWKFIDHGRRRYRLYIPEFTMILPISDRCIEDRYRGAVEVDTIAWQVKIQKSHGQQVLEYCPRELKYYVKVK